MSKSDEAAEERIPTYEESVSLGGSLSTLSASLASARSQRIEAILTTHIDPLLSRHAAAGLHHTTAILVPSNVSALSPGTPATLFMEDSSPSSSAAASNPDQEESVVSFPSSCSQESARLIRLHGPEYSLEFWTQPRVAPDLQAALHRRLAKQGLTQRPWPAPAADADADAAPSAALVADRLEREAAAERKRLRQQQGGGWFSRRRREEEAARQGVASPPPPETKPDSTGEPAPAFGEGDYRAMVALEEVSVRVLTDMGLYDSRSGMAVVVRVELA